MAEFKAIMTQEDFDAAIGERLNRLKTTHEEEIKGYKNLESEKFKSEASAKDLQKMLDEANEKIINLGKEKAGFEVKIKGYETDSAKMRIALATGLPHEMANRLSGETEEEITADAEAMFKLLGAQTIAPPLKSTEDKNVDEKTGAYKSLIDGLKGE